MASWTLGNIFSVNENQEVVKATAHEGSESGSDSEEEDDEEALEAQAAFKRNKKHSKVSNSITSSSGGSIRRYDEYGNFISRSERARAEQSQQSHTLETHGSGPLTHKLKVGFHDDDALVDVKELPPLSAEAKAACYMSAENCM